MKIIVVPSAGIVRMSIAPSDVGHNGVEDVIPQQLLEVATISATENRIIVDFAITHDIKCDPENNQAYIVVPVDGNGEPLDIETRIRTHDFDNFKERVFNYRRVYTWGNVVANSKPDNSASADSYEALRALIDIDEFTFSNELFESTFAQFSDATKRSGLPFEDLRKTMEAQKPKFKKPDRDKIAAIKLRAAKQIDKSNARIQQRKGGRR